MDEANEPLVLDLLEWLAGHLRPYVDVIEIWRTICPRLTTWEDATERGFVQRTHLPGKALAVELTPDGRDFLQERRRRL